MTARAIDPNNGWVFEDGRWVWEGGATTGHIEDGTVQGQITTWDVAKTEWTPDSSLTIDALGDASFSSDISLGSGSAGFAEARYTNLYMLGDDKDFGSRIFMSNSNNDWAVTSFGGGTADRWSVYSFSQAENVFQLDGDTGNATFSGTVDAAGFTVNGQPISGGGGGGFEDIAGDVNGNGYGWRHAGSTGNTGVFITNNGEHFCPSTADTVQLGTATQRWKTLHLSGDANATDFVAWSDERLKDNITTAPVGLIDSIKGREWDWSESGEKGSGVVAQELEQVLPHLVHEDEDGMKSVSYNGLVAYLIEEIKDLKAQVEALK